MKVVHIIFALNTGGSETMLVDIVNEQVLKADVNIIIVNRINNKELIQKIDKKVKVFFVNRVEGSRNLFPLIKFNLLIYKLNADILHFHNHNLIPLISPLLRRNALLTLHCMGIPTRHLKKYLKLFAISGSVQNDIFFRSNINSTIIYNGIQIDLIEPKDQHSIGPIFRIVQIGRLDHRIKGQDIAIEALYILKKYGITVQLDFIGTGESEEFLKVLVKKYELGNLINFLGLKDRAFIYSNLKNYNLLVQPSLNEGFGLTITEAMAAKIPVLISDIDGPMEIIENGKFGYFFISTNVINLAEAIHELIVNYNTAKVKEKTEMAFVHVCNTFSIKTTAKTYLEEYESLNNKHYGK